MSGKVIVVGTVLRFNSALGLPDAVVMRKLFRSGDRSAITTLLLRFEDGEEEWWKMCEVLVSAQVLRQPEGWEELMAADEVKRAAAMEMSLSKLEFSNLKY